MRSAACLVTLNLCLFANAVQEESIPKFGTTVVIPGGLRGVIYHIRHHTTRLPNFRKLKPAGTIYTASLDIPRQNFRAGFPGVTKRFEWFAIDYTGRFWIGKPGLYNFELTSDDGAKLYLDDELVIDNDGQHPPETKSGSIDLSGGIHRIRVSYFQGPRFEVALVLRVARAGEKLRIFSTDEFKPPRNPETWPEPHPSPPPAHRLTTLEPRATSHELRATSHGAPRSFMETLSYEGPHPVPRQAHARHAHPETVPPARLDLRGKV